MVLCNVRVMFSVMLSTSNLNLHLLHRCRLRSLPSSASWFFWRLFFLHHSAGLLIDCWFPPNLNCHHVRNAADGVGVIACDSDTDVKNVCFHIHELAHVFSTRPGMSSCPAALFILNLRRILLTSAVDTKRSRISGGRVDFTLDCRGDQSEHDVS